MFKSSFYIIIIFLIPKVLFIGVIGYHLCLSSLFFETIDESMRIIKYIGSDGNISYFVWDHGNYLLKNEKEYYNIMIKTFQKIIEERRRLMFQKVDDTLYRYNLLEH